MTGIQLEGSGGWVYADLTDEQVARSKLVPNIDKHFLGAVEKLDAAKMAKYFCKQCNSEFDGPAQIQVEETPNEDVADGLVLTERGQYTCHRCTLIIGEYRVFQKRE